LQELQPSVEWALAEVPNRFTGLVLASDAGHGVSPLAFCGETSQTSFGSEAWVTPCFGLAPQPVCAGSGALIVKSYASRWDNGNIHRGALSCEPYLNGDGHCSFLSLAPAPSDSRCGGSYL